MNLQSLGVTESYSGTTESENAGILHTDPGISFPKPNSVSPSSVGERTDPSIFLIKAPTENDLNEF